MFGVVESALGREGIGPVVRLDFSGAAARAGGGDAAVCYCGAPGALGLKAGVFRAQWGAAQQDLRTHVFEDPQEALLWEGLAGYLYVAKFDAQARHLWAADTALELLQPEVILVGNDRSWAGQAFAHVARRRGIPSVCVQDGVAGDVPWWWWLTADRLAATSAQLVEMLVRHGVSPHRCTVTGQPRYDLVVRSGPADPRAARAAVGVPPGFSVLFAVQTMHGQDYVAGVIAALLAVPGIHVMLRPHPSDRRTLWDRLMRQLGPERLTLHRGGDSLTLVRACDALVTQHSTVVLEAALLGKPVITADFGGLHGPAPVFSGAIATRVGGLEDLTKQVQRLANAAHGSNGHLRRSPHALPDAALGPADGHAGERVAALVAELLRGASLSGARGRDAGVRAGSPAGSSMSRDAGVAP